MKNWLKSMLCAVSAATLVACGGGGTADTTTTTTTTGGAASSSAITGIAGQMELAAGLTIDGIAAGFFGDFSTLSVPTGLETPMGMAYSAPSCTNEMDGSAEYSSEGAVTRVTYDNCMIDGSTLNGVVDITVQGSGTYLVTFAPVSANPFKVVASEDGKTTTFTYKGEQVVSELEGEPGNYTHMNVVLDAEVMIGTGSTITLKEFEIDFTVDGDTETITVNGDYSATIKLADFGVPVTPPMPETALIAFTVTTPTALVVQGDVEKQGIIKFASSLFGIETNYATKKITLTFPSAPSQEFPFE